MNTVLYHYGFVQTNFLRRKVISVTVDKWSHLLLFLLHYLYWKMMIFIVITSQSNKSVFLLLQGSFWRYSETACTCVFWGTCFVPRLTDVHNVWIQGSQAPGPGVTSSFHNLIDSCQGTECLRKHGKPSLPKVLCVHVEYRYVLVVLKIWENWHIQKHNCSLCWYYVCANEKYLVNIICVST